MKFSLNSKIVIHRRDLLRGATAAGLGLAAGGLGSSNVHGQSSVSKQGLQNLIQLENAKPGTHDWLLGAAKPHGPNPRVQRMMKNVFERFVE